MAIERRRPRWGMVPWGPSREMEEWQDRFAELFGPPIYREERGWMPAVDVFEKGDRFTVKAELPGMKEDDIDVSVIGDTLTIRGEKKTESEVKEEDYYRSERTYGSFYRSIPLPPSIDADKIEATYENGVLEVTLPKAAEGKAKKISVAKRERAKELKATK